MSARPRRAKSAGPAALPPPSTTATPRARKAPRASLAVVSGNSPRLAANLPQTPVGVSSRAWRRSILDGSYRGRSKGLALDERERFVRGPAEVALEGLCAVGKGEDEEEDDYGALHLSEENKRQYGAFESLKKAYFSDSTFLSAAALSSTYPDALADPFSPLSSLIKLSNLTTFLYLILSSAPTPDGTRPRTALHNLREAIGAFLSYIVPVDSQIHDGTLRMLVGLNCQAYLSASAHSRTGPPPIGDFFSAPLSSYLILSTSTAARDPLQNREASIRFNKYNADAIALVEKVGADLAVLETQWKFEDVALELRNYCESVARRIEGEQSASQELLAARISESEPESAEVEQQQQAPGSAKGKQRAVSKDNEEDSSDEEEEEEDVVVSPAAVRKAARPAEVEYDDDGDLEVDEGQEGAYDGEEGVSGDLEPDEDDEVENEGEDDQNVPGDADTTVDESAEEEAVALALGALSPRAIQAALTASQASSSPTKPSPEDDQPQTQVVELSTQRQAQIEAFRALQEEDDSQSQSQSQDEDGEDGDATMRAAISDGDLDEDEEELPATVNTQLPNRASEFKALYSDSEDENTSTQAQTQPPRPNAAAEFRALLDDLTDEDEHEDPATRDEEEEEDKAEAASLAAQADVDGAPQTRLAFVAGSNTLARVPIVARTGPSMFVRQPDAERILFDSQGDSPFPTPEPKNKGKGKARPPRRQPATSPLPNRPPKTTTSASKSKFLGVEIPVRTRRTTRSASAEKRSVSPVPVVVSRKGGARQRSPLEVPFQVGRSAGSSNRRGRSRSVIEEQPIDEEGGALEEETEQLGFGQFETETFDFGGGGENYGGGGEEEDQQVAPELEEEERVADEEFALQFEEEDDGIVVPPRLSKKAKGKGKAKRPKSPSPALEDIDEDDDDVDDSFVAQAMNFFGAQPAPQPASSSNKPRPSTSKAPVPRSTSHSSPRPSAGPSRPRSSTIKSKSKKGKQPESEGPGFQTDNESEDQELVKANRKRKRREPGEEYDEEIFDPVSEPRSSKKKRRAEEDFDTTASARRRKAQKAKMGRDDSSSSEELERPRKKQSKPDKHLSKKSRRRLAAITLSDSSSNSDSDISIQSFDNPPKTHRSRYAQGRNQTGRVPWTTAEEGALMKAMSELGCSWKKILDLYGAEGTSSRILKHRTIVSLKDKAVNVKAGMIRSGRAVPYFLANVTVSEKRIGRRIIPAPAPSSSDEE
ncbi:hypothetical protein BCR35DRAFT_307459 [Leucosporidium creatinivorum]|uniref:Myb-like domain-containing protein n=1 Tax=Leucosporidium creatinivorum TaxID=106004 RepID=A0A1Y2ENN8_9BASI|nr:hypothetical protein BCR35DRAFT_307459 [Leucosporidium creatinivorum]